MIGGEAFLAWLIQVWDLMHTGMQLDGTKARLLGSLAQGVAIEQAFVRESGPLSFRELLLANVREACLQGQTPGAPS